MNRGSTPGSSSPARSATAAAVVARVVGDARANEAVLLAAVIIAGTAVNLFLLRRARRRSISIASSSPRPSIRSACACVGEDVAPARAVDLRPGEEVLVEAGKLVRLTRA